MTKFASQILPEMRQILEHNGIDWKRCTDATVHHNPKDAVTEITVTLLALAPEEPT